MRSEGGKIRMEESRGDNSGRENVEFSADINVNKDTLD